MTDDTSTGLTASSAAIAAEEVTKRFPGVLANDAVTFRVGPGEVHTLLGENGAGKSTLAAMLCGLYQPDAGQIYRGGAAVDLRSPREGLGHGIGMVYQHFRLVNRFTVGENVVLGDPDQSFQLRPADINERVAEIGERFGLPINPKAVVADLTVGQRQRVEIVKMLYRGAEVLLLDEPTAVLTPQEVDALFVTVRRMTSEGKSVVFISHKLREVLDISDRVTVMRNGAVTGEVHTSETTERELAELMVGRPVERQTWRGTPGSSERLVADGLTVVVDDGGVALDELSLTVHEGEIVGVAGVAGNGQHHLARTLAGIINPDKGSVRVNGHNIAGQGPVAARRAGLSYVPADRLGTGLVPSLSATDNMLLTRKRSFFVGRKAARAEAEQAITDYQIKTPGPDANVGRLSGGNSQKVLLARELEGADSERVIIVASPTRGLDVGAAEFVRAKLDDARKRGVAVLLISEDLDEIRSLSDRVMVLYRGSIALESDTDAVSVDEIGLAMAGAATGDDDGEGAGH